MTFFIIGMTLFLTVLIGLMLVTRGWANDRAAMKTHIWTPREPITEVLIIAPKKDLPKGIRRTQKLEDNWTL